MGADAARDREQRTAALGDADGARLRRAARRPAPAHPVHGHADRDGQRKPPKLGSRRAAACPVWLQPELEQLVAVAEGTGGPDALLWPALLDPREPVRQDAFTTSYFHPQAATANKLLAHRGLGSWGAYIADVSKWTVHRSKQVTHDMDQGCLPEAVSHDAQATRVDPHQPVTLDAAPHR